MLAVYKNNKNLAKKDISQFTVSDWNDLLKEIMKETLEILSKED